MALRLQMCLSADLPTQSLAEPGVSWLCGSTQSEHAKCRVLDIDVAWSTKYIDCVMTSHSTVLDAVSTSS